MTSYTDEFNKVEEILSSLHDKDYISESTVNFFRKIIKAQYEVRKQLDAIKAPSSLTEETVKAMMINGKPLITWEDVPLKEPYLKKLFQEICEITKKREDSEVRELQRLIDAESNGDLSLRTLIEKLVNHESSYFSSLAKKLKVDEDLLIFVALHLAKPFYESVAEKLKDTIADKVADKVVGNRWLKHYCPVCGSSAQMAKLEKDTGKRMLFCLLCGSEWAFMRVKCPFCSSEEQKSLRFLEEEKSPYRIDLCETCKRYIKTFDERKGGATKGVFIPSVEDLATMYLDIVAEKEGFERSWFFPPSFDELKTNRQRKTLH